MLVDGFVEDDGAVVLQRLQALDERPHRGQRAHQPLHVRRRVVGGGLDGRALAFDVQNPEGQAGAAVCGDTEGTSQRLPSAGGTVTSRAPRTHRRGTASGETGWR